VRRAIVALGVLAVAGCAATATPPSSVPLAADVVGRVPVSAGRAELSGLLAFPTADGVAPAVVLMHGCSGVTPTMRHWAEALRSWGYATLVLDSFGGRGLTTVCESGALRSDDRVIDAYAALAVLARHPRIAASRIVLMGFSHGGGVVLLAASQWVARGYVGSGAPAFRAFVAFYPRCEGRYPGGLVGPLRVHIGALDDWTPASPCEAMVGSLRGGGADARITVYPGARHAFDAVGLPPERWLANVQAPHGRRGASVGHSPEATRSARENVRSELAEALAR
jgi:dienelactone hydrolase